MALQKKLANWLTIVMLAIIGFILVVWLIQMILA